MEAAENDYQVWQWCETDLSPLCGIHIQNMTGMSYPEKKIKKTLY